MWKKKVQIDDVILTAFTELSKRAISYTRLLNFPPLYLADILLELFDIIMTSYSQVKYNNYNF